MPAKPPSTARQDRSASRIGRRLDWRLIRISYFTLKVWGTVLLVAVLFGAGSVLYARSQGTESFLGRLLGIARRSVDRRLAMISSSPDEGSLLEQRYATLTFFTGRVEIQRATDLAWKDAAENMRLASGDRVRTFSSSRAEVGFDDGNVLRIKPDSLIVIGDLTENVRTKVRTSSVRLLVSSIEADIKDSVVRGSQFRFEMPTATAAVEKARLAVEIRPDKQSQVSVYSGQVAVDSGAQQVRLADHKSVTISALREISQAEDLLPAPAVRSPRPLETYPSASGGVAVPVAWDPVPGAQAYRLEVAGDRFFDKPVLARDDLRGVSLTTSPLESGVYHLRVAAVDVRGRAGDFSAPVPVRVVVDRVPPFIEIQKFVVLQTGRGREVLLNGRTEPGAAVSVGGQSLAVDETGYFSAVLKGVAVGPAGLEITARDRAGNLKSLVQQVQS